MKDFQRINHWPGMNSIHTKTGLAMVMRRMEKVFPEEFRNIHPQTWSLPEDWADFVTQFDSSSSSSSIDTSAKRIPRPIYIIKPAASCQGRGIYLIQDINQIQDSRAAQIAQRYIAKPLLVDGLKFDLRIYVCVTSVDPLRIWLFEEGLARFATTPYKKPNASNLHKVTQHLTNYAINCQSSSFQFNSGGVESGTVGSKRTLTWFRSWLNQTYGEGTSNIVWGSIIDMIIKTLIAAQPHLARTYRSAVGADATSMRCFEVLGLDVLLDANLKPWLLEINHSPSLTCDTPLDTQIKFALIKETMQLLRLRGGDRKRTLVSEAAAARQRLYGPNGLQSNTIPLSNDNDDTEQSVTPVNTPVSPAHVRATATAFTSFAAAIPEAHALNERKIAKKYRLIFPPPDPELIGDNIWNLNEKAYNTSKYPGNNKISNSSNYSNSNDNDDDDDTEENDIHSIISALNNTNNSTTTTNIASPTKSQSLPPPISPSSPQINSTKSLDGITFDHGVPTPFYIPWDKSKEFCYQRIHRYKYLLAVSTELYQVQTAASATGGRKAGNAAILSSASSIVEAMKNIDLEYANSMITNNLFHPSLPLANLPYSNYQKNEDALASFIRTIKAVTSSILEKQSNNNNTNKVSGTFASAVNKLQNIKRVTTAPMNGTRTKPSLIKMINKPSENNNNVDKENSNTVEQVDNHNEICTSPSKKEPINATSPSTRSPNSLNTASSSPSEGGISTNSSPSQYLPRASPPVLPPRNSNSPVSPITQPPTSVVEEKKKQSPKMIPTSGSIVQGIRASLARASLQTNNSSSVSNEILTNSLGKGRSFIFTDSTMKKLYGLQNEPNYSASLLGHSNHSTTAPTIPHKGMGAMPAMINDFGLSGKSLPISLNNRKTTALSLPIKKFTDTVVSPPYQQYTNTSILTDNRNSVNNIPRVFHTSQSNRTKPGTITVIYHGGNKG